MVSVLCLGQGLTVWGISDLVISPEESCLDKLHGCLSCRRYICITFVFYQHLLENACDQAVKCCHKSAIISYYFSGQAGGQLKHLIRTCDMCVCRGGGGFTSSLRSAGLVAASSGTDSQPSCMGKILGNCKNVFYLWPHYNTRQP